MPLVESADFLYQLENKWETNRSPPKKSYNKNPQKLSANQERRRKIEDVKSAPN